MPRRGRYKRYLEEGDAAIPKSTLARYKKMEKLEAQANEMNHQKKVQNGQDEQPSPMEVEDNNFNDKSQQVIFSEDAEHESNPREFYWINEITKLIEDSNLHNKQTKGGIIEFIQNNDVKEIIKINKSRGDIFVMILKFAILNGLSLTSLKNLFMLFNRIFEKPILPDPDHIVNTLLNPKNYVKFHVMCEKCTAYFGELEKVKSIKKCNICKAEVNVDKYTNCSFFALIDPSEQISNLLENHDNYYYYVTQKRNQVEGNISDVYDGKKYREFIKSLPREDRYNYVTAVFNSVGESKFKCSEFSIWPLYLLINELPQHIRTRKLITCGLMFAKQKPDMTMFVHEFVNLLNDCRIRCNIKNEKRLLKLYVLSCCADTKARARIQKIEPCNGEYGCSWCLHPGDKHGFIRYPVPLEKVKSRKHDETIALMLKANPDKPVFGVKNPSPLINCSKFNIVEGFTVDYVHVALEGVAKQFTSYHLDRLNASDIKKLDEKMSKITLPQHAGRYSRNLSCRNDWTPREWENFVIFYSNIIFKPLLKKHLMQHWLLFVEALYVLLKDNIDIDQLKKADEMLCRFVDGVQELYGVDEMTFNVHALLHIGRSVLNWGPVSCNSTFCFDSANYYLSKAIECADGAEQQVVRFVHIIHIFLRLEELVISKSNDDVVRYCNDIFLPKIENVKISNEILYFCGFEGDNEILKTLKLSKDSTKFFYKMVKDRCLYESYLVSQNRFNNSFALLKNGKFIRIAGFISTNENHVEITMCNYLHTKSCFSTRYTAFQIIEKIDTETVTVPTKDIRRICAFMNVDETYICPLPNLKIY